MTIIKHRFRQTECNHCNTIIEYDLKKDVIEAKDKRGVSSEPWDSWEYFYIECPICRKQIDVTEAVKHSRQDGYL